MIQSQVFWQRERPLRNIHPFNGSVPMQDTAKPLSRMCPTNWALGLIFLDALREHELELAPNHIPILTLGDSVLSNSSAGQTEHFAHGIIVGETRFVLERLAKLTVQETVFTGA